MRRLLPLVLLLAWLGSAWAQQLEILTLKYRSAEQLVPQLKPLLEPGAALSGTGDKLFLRTSPKNLADIRRVVDEIDREPRRLMISVRHGGERRRDERGAEIAGTVTLGKNVRIISSGRGDAGAGTMEIRRGDDAVRANAYEASSGGSERIIQQVQTIEGGRAWINVGQSLALPLRQVVATPSGVVVAESVSYRDIGTGFYVAPRLAGERVTLEISPSRDTPGGYPGSANIQRLSTTVSGRLGEWIELGGSAQESGGERAAMSGYAARSASDERRVWLKVDELR